LKPTPFLAAFAVLSVTLGPPGYARECLSSEATSAHYLAPELKTWKALYDAFLRYSQCDDGAVAGGFSESVSTVLAERWNTLRQGAALMDRDAKFKAFVFRHVGEETPADRWAKIAKNASSNCPKQQVAFCKELLRHGGK